MKYHQGFPVAIALCALVLGAGVAYAEDGQNGPHGPRPIFQTFEAEHGSTTPDQRLQFREHIGSSTMPRPELRGGHMGSTTPRVERMASTTAQRAPMRGVPGLVSEVDTDHFLMSIGGGDHATTTVTVAVSDATVFMQGSSTAHFSDVSVGARVEVLGRIATSTKTITAARVMINPAKHERMRAMRQEMKQSDSGDGQQTVSGDSQSSGNSQGQPKPRGMFERAKNIFNFFGGSQQGGDSQGAAAADGGAFLGGLATNLFGWIR